MGASSGSPSSRCLDLADNAATGSMLLTHVMLEGQDCFMYIVLWLKLF